MGILLEFKDYVEVHDALEMVNEGILSNMWNKLKDMFKGISGKVEQSIVSDEIDKMIDPKTQELTKPLLDQINAMSDTESTKRAFENIRGMAKEGWYFHQSLKFMEDGMVTLMDEVAATKVGTEQAGKTREEKVESGQEPQPQSQAEAAEKGASDELRKRAKDFDATYKKAKANLKKQVAAKMAELTKKSSADSTKTFINNRFSTCETVLLLIEYDIKKLRLGLESLDELKKDMTEAYKMSLNSAKQLKIEMEQAKAAGLSVENYEKLDINGFMKEYPAENPVAEGETADDKYKYPYAGLDSEVGIIITGYDVNGKTVSVQIIGANNKRVADNSLDEPIPFDEFKEKFLEGSDGTPPVKQKGGKTEPEKPAQPATADDEKNIA